MYVPGAFIPLQRVRRMAGWVDCENLQEGPQVKDAVLPSSFFSPPSLQTTLIGRWRAEKGRSRPGRAYESA